MVDVEYGFTSYTQLLPYILDEIIKSRDLIPKSICALLKVYHNGRVWDM